MAEIVVEMWDGDGVEPWDDGGMFVAAETAPDICRLFSKQMFDGPVSVGDYVVQSDIDAYGYARYVAYPPDSVDKMLDRLTNAAKQHGVEFSSEKLVSMRETLTFNFRRMVDYRGPPQKEATLEDYERFFNGEAA